MTDIRARYAFQNNNDKHPEGTTQIALAEALKVKDAEISTLRASNAELVRVNEVYKEEIEAWNDASSILNVYQQLVDGGHDEYAKNLTVAIHARIATDHAREGTK